MIYLSIDELNIVDAVKHLHDAERMNDPKRVQFAKDHLLAQINLVHGTNPRLYEKYIKELQEGEE